MKAINLALAAAGLMRIPQTDALADEGTMVRTSRGMYFRARADGKIKALGRVGGGSGTVYSSAPKDTRARVNGRPVTGNATNARGELTAMTGRQATRVGRYDPTTGAPHRGTTPIPHFNGAPITKSASPLAKTAPRDLPAGTYAVAVRRYTRPGDQPFFRTASGGGRGTITADGKGHALLTVPGQVKDIPLTMRMPSGRQAIHAPQRAKVTINGDRTASATMRAGKINPHGEIVDANAWLTLLFKQRGGGGWPRPQAKLEIRWDPKPAMN